jgi:hypothetical protein
MSVNNTKPSRRQFLGTAGLVGAGAVLASCAPATAATPGKANLDAAIANFALNLEYLEAAFYLAAVGRLAELPGGSAQIILPAGMDGRTAAPFGPAVAAYAQEIAQDELNHVLFLRKVLGANAVDRPVLDIGPAFAAAANAAAKGAGLATPLSPAFNPYLNDLFFLHGAFIFEDVGVTAYNGAATLITNPAYLQAAAGILAVEAYHGGAVRTLLYQQRQVTAAAGLYVGQVVAAISALRAKVGGGKDMGLSDNAGAVIAPADKNGVAYARTTSEVLAIVYLGGKGKGGFYPNGLNGAIK